MRIAIVDYRMGNLQSVKNAFGFLGFDALITEKPADIACADVVVLPGVGAFGEAMRNLRRQDLIKPLADQVLERKVPFLGICLGMQLLSEWSDENGNHEGLGWLPGHVRRIPDGEGVRVPHVGWNSTVITRADPLFHGFEGDPDFYYVHSYHVEVAADYVSAHCLYGQRLTASVNHANIRAVQFHPEKSQFNGLRLLRNFMNLSQAAHRA